MVTAVKQFSNKELRAMSILATHPAAQKLGLDDIEEATSDESTGVTGQFRDLALHSHFQPIISLVHRRVVGHEGLVRPRTATNQPIPPDVLFERVESIEEVVFLDRLARNIHVRNFVRQSEEQTWLFLNVNARVAMSGAIHAPYFAAMLARYDLPPHRVVIELIENEIADEGQLAEAMRYYAELGCLVAVDDFGAGQSNFDRIWRIQPQIVKIDRASLVHARNNKRVRRVLPSLVSLLHEAGCMTLIEGIENEDDVMISLDSGVDFVQGYYFGRPQSQLVEKSTCAVPFGYLCNQHAQRQQASRQSGLSELSPYIEACRHCGEMAAEKWDAAEASLRMLTMPNVLRCFLLDKNGRQLGSDIALPSHAIQSDKRFLPVANGKEAVWSRRPYFQRALASPGQVQVSRPYLSITDAKMCVTLSVLIRNAAGQEGVYCVDILHS